MLLYPLLSIYFSAKTVAAYCEYGTEYTNATGCFQFFRTPLNFTNAVRFCRVNLKATLARPTSFARNQQLQLSAMKLGIEEYWIGASNVDNDWEWLDGSMLTYSNFDVDGGYPKRTESQIGAVSMGAFSGLWYTKLDVMMLPFVCELPLSPLYDNGTKAPLLMVESADQSVLYPSGDIGPLKHEIETGEKVYLKPININAEKQSVEFSGSPVVVLNPYKRKIKVKPVIISQIETEMNRTISENEETEDEINAKTVKQEGSGGSANNGSSAAEELHSISKANRSREENEMIRQKTIEIKRG